MIEYQVFRIFLDFSLLIFGLWALASIAAQRMLLKRKSRPRLEPSKRQAKITIYSVDPFGRFVKSEVSK